MKHSVRLSAKESHDFDGECLASVAALNHDGSVRRQFHLYATMTGYVAARVDDPDTIDIRYWGAVCATVTEVYDFFGNKPLANYLYGYVGFTIPGLRIMSPSSQ